jgi:hypothetical protein
MSSCGVPEYASTQILDFLDLARKPPVSASGTTQFPPEFPDGNQPGVSGLFSLDAGPSRRHVNVLGADFSLNPGDAPFGALAVIAEVPSHPPSEWQLRAPHPRA